MMLSLEKRGHNMLDREAKEVRSRNRVSVY